MKLLFTLFQAMAIFFVLFHLYARSPAFRPFRTDWLRPRAKLSLLVFFTGLAILGTYLGLPLAGGAIANTRAVGAVLAGMLGGPITGVAVGVLAGAHRITLGGFTAVAGAIATTLEGLLGGVVHRWLVPRDPERLIDWKLAFTITAIGETIHMLLLLLISRPFQDSVEIVKGIGLPMIIANSVGAALFMTVLRDRHESFDKVSAASSTKALRIAERTLAPLAGGLDRRAASQMADIIQEELRVAAVAITDTERILAFVGQGADHHRPGLPIASPLTRRAITAREVVFADGEREHYDCTLVPSCPLDSVAVIPLVVDGACVGTVQLFETARRRLLRMNRSLGKGIADLLSNQLLLTRFQEQKNLLVVAELKLIQAQVNPHFLFNSLNTIIAITRTDPGRARELLVHLSNFFRKNLKRSGGLATLEEELAHVSSYLEIEKARFGPRLVVETDVDPALYSLQLPTFTLQPLIENAIKHGVSATLGTAHARIRAQRVDGIAVIEIEDDAGTYAPTPGSDGLGMNIVDKRIKNLLGAEWGVTVTCTPGERTRVTVRVPLREVAA
jgi:two-component system, LytTR family, sensor kinase